MGVLKIVPNNGGSVTLTSVLDSARAAITLYSDAARSTAVTLPATVSGSTKLYPPVTYAGQLWLKASAPGGVVVTGSGATALPEYDVVRIHLLDADVTEAPVSARDNAGFAAGELPVRSVDGAAGDVDLSGTYVRTVNGTGPDGAGNVAVSGSGSGLGTTGPPSTVGSLTPTTGRVPEVYSGRNSFFMQLTASYAGNATYVAAAGGVLTGLSAAVQGNDAARVAHLYVMRPSGGNYVVAYDSGAIAMPTAGTYTHTPASAFPLLAGDVPAIHTSPGSPALGLKVAESGGNDVGHAVWLQQAAPAVGSVTGTFNSTNAIAVLTMTVSSGSALDPFFDIPGGFPRLDADTRIKVSARPTVDNYWHGKKILHVGTSIPATAGSYAFNVAAMLGATVDNQSVGSSGIVWDGIRQLSLGATQAQLTAAGFGASVGQSYEAKVIGKNADLYVFDHGCNDASYTIGTITDATAATFYGAYNVVLNALLTEKPTAQIMLITPISYYWPSGVYNANIANIRTAMLAIGAKFGIPVLDFTQTMLLGATGAATYLPDQVHPNQEWHDIAGRRLYRFIRDI